MAKKQKKPKKATKAYMLYEISGERLVRKNKPCLKCGPSVFMARHRGRLTCGQCGYTEFEKRT